MSQQTENQTGSPQVGEVGQSIYRENHAPSLVTAQCRGTTTDIVANLWKVGSRYLDHLRYKNRAEATIYGVKRDLRLYFAFLAQRGIETVHVGTEEMEEYKAWLRRYRYIDPQTKEPRALCVGYVADQLRMVRQFYRYLCEEGEMMMNPMEGVRIPKVPDDLPRGIMTRAEVGRVLRRPNLRTLKGYRDRAVLEVLYGAGLRNAEVCRLRISDVDLDQCHVTVVQGKGNKDRVVPIPEGTARILARYIKDIRPNLLRETKHRHVVRDDTLFVGVWGSKLDPDRVGQIVARHVTAAEVARKITPHSFRHTVATHLLQNGMDVRYVQEFLGHQFISTTQRYTRVEVERLREKVEDARRRGSREMERPAPVAFEGGARITYGKHRRKAD